MYTLNHNGEFIRAFEEKVADYCGAKFGVAVDSGTSALFLAFKFRVRDGSFIPCPKRTYMSVPMAIINSGNTPMFHDHEWEGKYQFYGWDIYDMCGQFYMDMYKPVAGSIACLSFQSKKILSIGKGGMILTDDAETARLLRRLAFDGRDYMLGANEDSEIICGYHMNMTPDDAAKGIIALNNIRIGGVSNRSSDYRDLTEMECFRQYE